MSKSNTAYDLSKYENAAPKLTREEKSKIKVKKATPATTGSPLKIIALTVAVGLMLGLVIYAKVENAAIHTEINAETKAVDILRSENVRMQTEIESKSALKSVEEYAENVLGMQKLDKSQIEYLSLENGNVVDIPDNDENLFVKIKRVFENFVEYLRG
jgi:uncharacterized protein HemX